VDQLGRWRASILWGEDKLNLAGLGNDIVLRAVLISESVSADDNGFSPSWDKSGDIADYDGFTEDCSI
jgi:hypothetical protein